MHRLLKARAGFTLAELLVAMVLTTVVGAALTSVFVVQAKFFDTQEKVSAARGVSRSGMNIIMSELRMLEQTGGVISATNQRIVVRAPYAMALICTIDAGNKVTISRLPVDSVKLAEADTAFDGWAYRSSSGTYTYVTPSNPVGIKQKNQGASNCTNNGIAIVNQSASVGVNLKGAAEQIQMSAANSALAVGMPLFLFYHVTYEFKASVDLPGRIGLFRNDTELLAPFDTTAKFRFYVNDASTAQDAVPTQLNTITGLELVLDGQSDRIERDGSRQTVPMKTSVFFKNRL